ncbi:MAG TPA: hypothetical protein PLG20_04840 [Candidatus Syntrophosphaera sp.]|jgi:hypothetical protein|nr:hypothetical protein [Candidatus Syntrophosphaera sp.]
MTDLDDKYRERLNERRKSAYNWKRLIIMGLALLAILIAINRLNKVGTGARQPAAEYIDSTATAQPPQQGLPQNPGDKGETK